MGPVCAWLPKFFVPSNPKDLCAKLLVPWWSTWAIVDNIDMIYAENVSIVIRDCIVCARILSRMTENHNVVLRAVSIDKILLLLYIIHCVVDA